MSLPWRGFPPRSPACMLSSWGPPAKASAPSAVTVNSSACLMRFAVEGELLFCRPSPEAHQLRWTRPTPFPLFRAFPLVRTLRSQRLLRWYVGLWFVLPVLRVPSPHHVCAWQRVGLGSLTVMSSSLHGGRGPGHRMHRSSNASWQFHSPSSYHHLPSSGTGHSCSMFALALRGWSHIVWQK